MAREAGVLTPASAMGITLLHRLQQASAALQMRWTLLAAGNGCPEHRLVGRGHPPAVVPCRRGWQPLYGSITSSTTAAQRTRPGGCLAGP